MRIRARTLATAATASLALGLLGASGPATADPAAHLAAVPPAPAAAASGSPLKAALDAEIAAGVTGAFAETHDGAGRVVASAGVADRSTLRPIEPHFSHRVGSITKTFVTAAVLQLVAEGRVSLDDTVGAKLPELFYGDRYGNTLRDHQRATVRQVLQHTSGIGENLTAIVADVNWAITTSQSHPVLAEMGLRATPLGPAGAAHRYANTNFVLAGLLVEKVTGRSLEDEVTARIIEPLGLSRTYFPRQETRVRGPHAIGYLPIGSGQLLAFDDMNVSLAWGAGDLVSTTADLNTFFTKLLGGSVLPAPQLTAMTDLVDSHGGYGYGLGLMRLPIPCATGSVNAYGHLGTLWGAQTFSLHTRDGRRGISSAKNHSHDPRTSAAEMATISTALCDAPAPTSRLKAAQVPALFPPPLAAGR